MKKRRRIIDPFAEREARKYEHPIPSRELVLEVLAQHAGPMRLEALLTALNLTKPYDIEAMTRRISAMTRGGQIVHNRRGELIPVDKTDLVRGRVVGHPDGFGFLIPDEGGEDLFLSPREMRALLHGDRAVVRPVAIDARGRREGALVEVLERQNREVTGRLFIEGGIGLVAPDNKRIHQDILIPGPKLNGAKAGQIVVAAITDSPTPNSPPLGEIIEVLGEHLAPGMEVDIAIRSHGLPHGWPAEVMDEAAGFAPEVPKAHTEGRLDLRDLPLVTIDGEDARDFDDAVFASREGRGWRLMVAIADVSSYVAPNTALNQEAQHRGTSVYFPNRVIPMLPEVLSNGLCSLNPQVDRLCLACEMQINAQGVIKQFRFHEAVMRSAARLTYAEVAAMVIEQEANKRAPFAHLVEHLDTLYALYQVLAKARQARHAIDFETQETQILYGPDGRIERIVPRPRTDAHRLIEECMIAANVCAARFLLNSRLSALYRVHGGPSVDKLAELRSFLGELGLALGGGDEPKPEDYARLIEHIANRPDRHLIQTVLLRSLSQAVYSPDNAGHFGLALEAYTHFTSPIRRYPDLLVHRAIRHRLHRRSPKTFYSHNDMVSLGEHCSMTERRADEATREAVAWLKCEYMQDKVGETFEGLISGVTSFGLFVELNEIFVEGLAHVTSLPADYYHFDPAGHRLVGRRGGRTYRLGDPLQVRVMRVSLDERKIDFEPVQPSAPNRSRRSARRRRKA